MLIQGFKVLELAFSSENTSFHNVFIKEHSIRTKDELKPPGQTLFVLNVPPIATEIGLKNAFSTVGNIKQVIFEDNTDNKTHDGFRRAYIVFYKREHLLKALKLNKLNVLSTQNKPVKFGLIPLMENYNKKVCDSFKLKDEINNFMSNCNRQEKKDNKEEGLDDDGWTLVTKAGRRPGLSRKESLSNKLNDKVQKNSKKKELKNFYTFQIRESKMKNIATLRKNFEEAKNKVLLMKQARKFKPY